MSSFPLTKSMIFQDGHIAAPTNRYYEWSNGEMGIYQRCYNECNWTSQSTDWMAWNLSPQVWLLLAKLLGGDWNHGIWWLSHIGNGKSSQLTQSFFRGVGICRAKNHQAWWLKIQKDPLYSPPASNLVGWESPSKWTEKLWTKWIWINTY